MNAYSATATARLPRSIVRPRVAPTRRSINLRWRTALTWSLAAVWLLDAALQFQPYMFTRAFPNEVIAPAGDGSPAFVSGPVNWAADLMAGHIVVFNALFAMVQLGIAIGLLIPATLRLALAGSIAWSVSVWWLGEGLGGLFAGPASPLSGVPGAVILYALLAALLWPPRGRPRPTAAPVAGVARRGLLGARGAAVAWLALWALFAFEALRPGNRQPNGLRDQIAGMADGEPRWLASINNAAARVVAQHGLEYSIGLAALCAFVGVSVLVPRLARAGVVLAVVLALVIWVVAQDLGEIATGTSTDPNSAVPLVILALCYWPVDRARSRAGATP